MKIELTKEELLLIHGICFNEMLNMSKNEKEYKQYLDEKQIKARHEKLDYLATKVLNAHNSYID